MLIQYLGWVHPPVIVELMGAVDDLLEILQVLFVFSVFQEVDMLVVFNGQHIK